MLNHKPCFRGIINVNVLMLSTFTVNNIMYRAQLFEYNNKIHPKIDQPAQAERKQDRSSEKEMREECLAGCANYYLSERRQAG